MTRTRFYEAKNLEFARVGNTILKDRKVLNLVVTGNGREKSYIRSNLKGANLKGADLKKANFKEADISQATFQGACLEWTNLTLTQAVGTNFTHAQMTGACLEDWNIKSTTKLDNVDCRFVYLLEDPKPGTDDHERRPSSGDFQSGEFTQLFQEVLKTVDEIINKGITSKAYVKKRREKIKITRYSSVEKQYKALLQAKDEEINFHRQQSAKIPEMIISLANQPINVRVENKVENKNMTHDSSRTVKAGRDIIASGQAALNLGEISGTVTNTINELPSAPEPEKPGIKEILTQPQTAIEADTDLTPKDKEKALKQVKSLAEAAQNPQEKQDLADTAITMLKGIISGLPSAASLVEQCSKLLPLISGFLGLG